MAEDTTTVVTERAGMITEHQMSQVLIVAMPPWKIVLVRSTRVYLMALTGLLGAAGIGVTADVGVTMHAAVTMIQAVGACVVLAAGPALVSAAWNTLELFKQWDASHPELRA
jgi:hypothetical protein